MSTLSQLGREVQRLQDRALAEHPRPPVDERLAAVRSELARRQKGTPRYLGLALVAAAAAVLIGLGFMWRPGERPLTAMARGEAVLSGAWIASDREHVPVTFSDGTVLTLAPRARARLLDLGAQGAELALERGSVEVAVVHRPNASWRVAAGPFEIRVTGTRFDASWEPEGDRLRVAMREGSVEVLGKCLGEPQRMKAGDSRDFSCTAPATSSPPPVHVQQPVEPPAPTLTGSTPRPRVAPALSASARDVADSWHDLARAGRFKEALLAAEAHGFSGLATTLGAGDVLELGNVARLAGNPGRASEAYLAARQRFAGSSAAASAAFQLGRMAFDGARDYGAARRWFGAYLAEQPGGALAQEALGRLMEAEHRSGDATAAELSAKRYLARFPNGAHAALARNISGE